MGEGVLTAEHRALGVAVVEVDGIAVPERFGDDDAAAVRTLTEDVAVVDLAWRAHVRATGKHRARFLHNMTTCEVKALEPGEGRLGATVDARGRLVATFWLDTEADAVLLEIAAGRREAFVEHLLKHRVADRIALEAVDGRRVLGLVGPRADEALRAALGEEPGIAEAFAWRDTAVAGVAARVRRNDARLGLRGWDVTVDEGDAAEAWRGLVAAGAVPVGHAPWEIVRVAQGVPRDGVDLGEDNVPLESDWLYAQMDWDKGCYIGQEVIAMMHYRGRPNRHLVGVRLDAKAELPAPGATLETAAGKAAGVVGTAVRRPDGSAMALAVVKRKQADAGSVLRLGEAEVEVIALRSWRDAGATPSE